MFDAETVLPTKSQGTTIERLPNLSLSAATALYGLTPRAIRLYEERGLIRVGRDHLNRRYYDLTARAGLEIIVALRLAGVSLSDIKQVLISDRSNAPELAIKALTVRAARLNDALRTVDAAIAHFRCSEIS